MPYKDPARAKAASRERGRRYRQRQHEARYGSGVGNMSGRHGNQARGAANGRWNAGRLITSHGYVAVRVPKDHPRAWGPTHGHHRYAYEHDLLMEQKLGRDLLPNEIVHHLPNKLFVSELATTLHAAWERETHQYDLIAYQLRGRADAAEACVKEREAEILRAYHVTLDGYHAPANEWPCNRVAMLVKQYEARLAALREAVLGVLEPGGNIGLTTRRVDPRLERLRQTYLALAADARREP